MVSMKWLVFKISNILGCCVETWITPSLSESTSKTTCSIPQDFPALSKYTGLYIKMYKSISLSPSIKSTFCSGHSQTGAHRSNSHNTRIMYMYSGTGVPPLLVRAVKVKYGCLQNPSLLTASLMN